MIEDKKPFKGLLAQIRDSEYNPSTENKLPTLEEFNKLWNELDNKHRQQKSSCHMGAGLLLSVDDKTFCMLYNSNITVIGGLEVFKLIEDRAQKLGIINIKE
jgi:hypothetical protein